MARKPSMQWGIINAPVNHVIQAIGTSTIQKAEDFVKNHCPSQKPKLTDSYEGCYNDTDVDVIYIGTPHSFHKRDCLNAIAAGKNVLCEKAFTITATEAKEVAKAARGKGVYVHEAMWLRHRPLVQKLRELLYGEKVIGDVFRMFCDFGLEVDVPNMLMSSRYRNLELGAGTTLDMGVYTLTWASLALDPGTPKNSEKPDVHAFQTKIEGVDLTTSILMHYPSSEKQGIVTSTTNMHGDGTVCGCIDGTNGYIELEGPFSALAYSFTVYPKRDLDWNALEITKKEGKKYDFPKVSRGFIYEADNTALDILAGKKESEIMPLDESIRVMELLDEIRRQGGVRYPADDE